MAVTGGELVTNPTPYQRIMRSPWLWMALALYFSWNTWPWHRGGYAIFNLVMAVIGWFTFWAKADAKWGKP